ncbi:DUF2252 domain-containing protein [Actinotalea sp. M2MS4P-6]|uniref:DUF2252 domain-containing protein n=1 Tax=Actinotalea sp. M2MS4P-6 TaxID=2983762 RepID=UPI0021E35A1F|nr:DUF2252 domain-containing protein [Actinotalea sp. M2MS4P-6]MCV2394263.1 DUF2252 domain-containing protein [Actinotalea sp. M2MS4P-6]
MTSVSPGPAGPTSATVSGPPSRVRPGTAERAAVGRAARRLVPRAALAAWDPPADREDPVALLEEQSASRVPELVPIRYGRMMASPFAFFRGGAAIMAADLAASPSTGLHVQLCGDAHLANFGVGATPERALVFDLNDFDETLPGPWEWDVKRLAASLAVAGRANGFTDAERQQVVLACVERYRTAMAEFAPMGNLELWYSRISVEPDLPRFSAEVDRRTAKEARKVVAKAWRRDAAQAAARLTAVVDGHRRIMADPPLVVPVEDLAPTGLDFDTWMRSALAAYRESLSGERRHLVEQFDYAHAARKVVGVGSVGTRAWIVLMVGRDDDDALLLQAKEAQTSVLERHLGPSTYPQHGQRVVEGQRLMQAASDITLGWTRIAGVDGVERDFYVRQLRDWKASWDPATMNPTAMVAYGRVCGQTLARAHARSGDRVAIAAYLGSGDNVARALAAFAEAYADQNERDHAALVDAIRNGQVGALPGL